MSNFIKYGLINNDMRGDYDILIDSFAKLDTENICDVPMICIYQNPNDYPGYFVARLYDIEPGKVNITRYIMVNTNIENIRNEIPSNFSILPGIFENEDPNLVAVYIGWTKSRKV